MKTRTSFVCQQCGNEAYQWYGKCPECGEWNSMVETVKEDVKTQRMGTTKPISIAPQLLSEVQHIESSRLQSGIKEFDRVMGGGIVPGSVTLLAGDPGIGKSTLLLRVIDTIGGIYISGEESAEQIQLRAKRMNVKGKNIVVVSDTRLEGILTILEDAYQKRKASSTPNVHHLVVVDSIQTISSDELSGMAGSVGQIRACSELLVRFAKTHQVPIIIIGHVTKEGDIAGPKILEHMVDTVLYFEGERYQEARILRTRKNRFGAVDEVGLFEMDGEGLAEITNPSKLFLTDRVTNVPGSVVTVIMEGSRPLLVEIQALVVSSQLAMPRRVVNGCELSRVQLIIAVIQKRLNIPLGTFDVFVNVSGGLKIQEPASDLAIALAIISSFKNMPIDIKTVIFGEMGLLGEIRRVGRTEPRKKEAKRLGFTTVISPQEYQCLSAVHSLLFR